MREEKAIKLIRKPKNRFEKRKYKKELEWLKEWYYEKVIPLEQEFWDKLLKEGSILDGKEYTDIYVRYVQKFISLCDKTNHQRLKFNFFDTNIFYFENLYAPVENLD